MSFLFDLVVILAVLIVGCVLCAVAPNVLSGLLAAGDDGLVDLDEDDTADTREAVHG